MIKQSRITLMDLTKQIIHESWKGNYSLLFENADQDADIEGPHSYLVYDQYDNPLSKALDPYISSFSILKEQYTCYEAKGPVCIIKGEFEILKDKNRLTQQLKAVWQQKGSDYKIIDFDVTEKTAPKEIKPAGSSDYFVRSDTEGTMHMIPKDEIISVESSGNYVDMYTENGAAPFRFRSALRSFVAELDDQRFVLFGRNRIINLQAIDKITANTLIMNNGFEYPISIKHRTEIRSRLRDFANRKS